VRTTRPLEEHERYQAQVYLVRQTGADPGSVSGEHRGRLAGLRNWKRGGCWVNVLEATDGPAWETVLADLEPDARPSGPGAMRPASSGAERDRDESVAEFAWVCHRLREGVPPDQIESELAQRARDRGKPSPAQYAARTLQAAMRRLET